MDHTKQNLDLIEEYFRSSCKPEGTPFRLGVEIEHFLMDKNTHRSAQFFGEHGVEKLLERLAPHFDEKHYTDGILAELDCGDYNITLEPSCQFEISIMPEEKIETIEQIYAGFRSLTQPVLDEFGLEFLNYGYNPYEKNEEMVLIPKKRYACMDRYFKEIGTKGSHMMRSTASTQVSIDYFSEEDFVKKFRSVYVLGPLLALFADNCPVYEGEKNTIYIRRQKIWRDVDPHRVNVFDYIDFNNFGFRDYAEYVYHVPLAVSILDGETAYTTKTACEVYKDRTVEKKDIQHILSMVFPMARLKTFVEIRCGDSMPIERSLAFTALIKGLYLKPEKLYNLMDEFDLKTAQDTISAEDAVMENGPDAIVYGLKASEVLDRMLSIATENLPQEERRFLC